MMLGLESEKWKRRRKVATRMRRAKESGRERRCRQAAEEPPGQPAAVVENDARATQASGILAIWNHSTL